jgi:uncharacterized protein (TIGR02453 family)
MKKQAFALDIPPPPVPFEGFSTKAFQFLHGLKKNNTKQWFDSHRADYESYLREPSKRLVDAMAMHIEDQKLPLVADHKRSLFRINRDIRFSADKSPYKTHIGIVFPVKGLGEDEWTGMYLGIEAMTAGKMKVYVGGGAHEPSAPYLKKIREKLVTNYSELRKAAADKQFKKEFPNGLVGASLSRAPRGYEEDHPAIDLLKMKSFEFGLLLAKEDLMNSHLPELLTKKFKAGVGVLEFFKI